MGTKLFKKCLGGGEYMIHVEINVSEKFTDKVVLTASYNHKDNGTIERYLKAINKSFNSSCYNKRIQFTTI